MLKEAQIKALAELDGWEAVFEDCASRMMGTPPDWSDHGYRHHYCKAYLTSYDAIIPLIQKQSEGIREFVYEYWHYPLSVTPAQLCEALLRATGKWTE